MTPPHAPATPAAGQQRTSLTFEHVPASFPSLVVVRLSGELTEAAAPPTAAALAGVLAAAGVWTVVVDLRGATEIDACGVEVLVEAHRAAERTGRALLVVSPGQGPYELVRAADRAGALHVLDRFEPDPEPDREPEAGAAPG